MQISGKLNWLNWQGFIQFHEFHRGEGVIDTVSCYLVSYPAPNPRAGKGLVTLERFLDCIGVVSHSQTLRGSQGKGGGERGGRESGKVLYIKLSQWNILMSCSRDVTKEILLCARVFFYNFENS